MPGHQLSIIICSHTRAHSKDCCITMSPGSFWLHHLQAPQAMASAGMK